MKLSGKISAIVTGGASGLGAQTAKELAGRGVKVALFDLDRDKGEALAKEISGVFCACDVTDHGQIEEALTRARAAHGQERILVNCAGIAIGEKTTKRDRDSGAISHHDLDRFAKVISINLIGSFNMIAQVAAGMMTLDPLGKDAERGVIISTSSVAARDGQIGQVAYAASKGGVASMTLPIARDLAREGIRVMSILPGLFETPMFDTLPDDIKKALGASVPFPNRLGSPLEYAALARHICENPMLNGECIRLDGAIRLAPK